MKRKETNFKYLEDYSTMELLELADKGIMPKSKYAPKHTKTVNKANPQKKAKRKATQKSQRRQRKC